MRNSNTSVAEYFTIGELSELLGVTTQSVRVWIRQGSLPTTRAGRAILISKRDLGCVKGGLGAFTAFVLKDALDALIAGNTDALQTLRDRLVTVLQSRERTR